MIKVLLAEDHTIVRKGLCSLLEDEEDIKVVGEAADGQEAVEKVQQLQPDVVVMDISMPKLNGLEATRQIKKLNPGVKVLVLTLHSEKKYIVSLLKAGAAGYLVKESIPEELIAAIRDVYHGSSYLSPSVAKVVVDEYVGQSTGKDAADDHEDLSDREREVLQLIVEGSSALEIAERLSTSIDSAVKHQSILMRKLNVRNSEELRRFALSKGIINPDNR